MSVINRLMNRCTSCGGLAKVPVQQLTQRKGLNTSAGCHRALSSRGVLHHGGRHRVDAGAWPEQWQDRPRLPRHARRHPPAARPCARITGIVRTEFKDHLQVVHVWMTWPGKVDRRYFSSTPLQGRQLSDDPSLERNQNCDREGNPRYEPRWLHGLKAAGDVLPLGVEADAGQRRRSRDHGGGGDRQRVG